MYNEVNGNIIALALEGKFDVIAHGCNCLSTMGAGLAPQMAKTFGCDKFEMELRGKDINKLGCIDYERFVLGENSIWSLEDADNKKNEPEVTVVNAYTQYMYGRNHANGVSRPIDYEALALCMRKMNTVFKGTHIGLPQIGAGLAGGDWNRIKGIIIEELIDCRVTVVIFNRK
jgi:O-acetyl-ADP-ribose deacetylase (regulator of RNase III)